MLKRPQAVLPADLTAELPSDTYIGKEVCIIGSLHFQGTLTLDGSFEGETLSSGTLILTRSGTVIANLHLEEATIFGTVKGNISVTKRLTLKSGSSVEGDILAPILHVEEGVQLKGRVDIQEPKTAVDELDDDLYSSDN
ncbi:MAG: hypothetical protein RLZZ453_1055 [Chlamydiota bacterium]|jgi:cytoskeletal protein CcmA (bactofilin family)